MSGPVGKLADPKELHQRIDPVADLPEIVERPVEAGRPVEIDRVILDVPTQFDPREAAGNQELEHPAPDPLQFDNLLGLLPAVGFPHGLLQLERNDPGLLVVRADGTRPQGQRHAGDELAVIGRNLQSLDLHGVGLGAAAELFRHSHRSVGQKIPELALTTSRQPQKPLCPFGIAEPEIACCCTMFDGVGVEGEHAARRYRVDPVIVAEAVQRRDLIEVENLQVGAQQADVLVVEFGFPAFMIQDRDAAVHRTVRTAVCGDSRFVKPLAVDLPGVGVSGLPEVADRQRGDLVAPGQNTRGSLDGPAAFLVDRPDFFQIPRSYSLHPFRVCNRYGLGSPDDDGLESLGAHHRSHAWTAAGAAFQATDHGIEDPVFSTRPDGENPDILSVLGVNPIVGFDGPSAPELIRSQELHPVILDVEAGRRGGLPLDNQNVVTGLPEMLADPRPQISVAVASGQRGLGRHHGLSGVGGRNAGNGTQGHNELVLGTQRIDAGFQLVPENFERESAPADPLFRELLAEGFPAMRLGRQVNPQDVPCPAVHVCPPRGSGTVPVDLLGSGFARRRLADRFAEQAGFLIRRPDRLGKDGAQRTFFHLIDRFGRRTSRRSDHVAQFGRMPFRLLCIEDRTEHRFDNDVVRNVARESEMNGGIDQCLQDQECVCRSGSADGGGHVEILFIVDLNFLAERLKNHTRLFPLCIVHVRRRRPYGQTLADLRRRVRHRAHDRLVGKPIRQGGNPSAGDDRQDQLIGTQHPFELGQNSRKDLRFDGQNHHISLLHGAAIVGCGADGVALLNASSAFFVGFAHDHAVRSNGLVPEQSLNHRLPHHTAADKRDRAQSDFSHRSYSSRNEIRFFAEPDVNPVRPILHAHPLLDRYPERKNALGRAEYMKTTLVCQDN